jgi:hypothetical protein
MTVSNSEMYAVVVLLDVAAVVSVDLEVEYAVTNVVVVPVPIFVLNVEDTMVWVL